VNRIFAFRRGAARKPRGSARFGRVHISAEAGQVRHAPWGQDGETGGQANQRFQAHLNPLRGSGPIADFSGLEARRWRELDMKFG
jgi:hypothetical protein